MSSDALIVSVRDVENTEQRKIMNLAILDALSKVGQSIVCYGGKPFIMLSVTTQYLCLKPWSDEGKPRKNTPLIYISMDFVDTNWYEL